MDDFVIDGQKLFPKIVIAFVYLPFYLTATLANKHNFPIFIVYLHKGKK